MFKTLTPIFGILIAVVLFFAYIRPTFDDIRVLQEDAAEYAQAVEQAAELQRRIATLEQERSAIALADLERLAALIPEQVDEVRALIDLDALARAHRLALGDIEVGSSERGAETAEATPQTSFVPASPVTAPATAAIPQAAAPAPARRREEYSVLPITFSVLGAYEDFRSFLFDLERSLAFMEVTKITFASSEGDAVSVTVGIRLYSLKPSGP